MLAPYSKGAGLVIARDPLTVFLVTGLLFTIGCAGVALGRENLVLVSQKRLETQSDEIKNGYLGGDFHPHPADTTYPARARITDALYMVRRAQQALPSRRRADLDGALSQLAIAQGERPVWGEARIVSAFAHALRDGEDAAATRQMLAQSYADAPYVRSAAAWRVQFGLRHWTEFNAMTRRHIIDEAVWITRIDDQSQQPVFDLARNSPAYQQFMLRWLNVRVGDVDFGSASLAPSDHGSSDRTSP